MHRAHESRVGAPRPERRGAARAALLALSLVVCVWVVPGGGPAPAVQKSESEVQLEFGARVARMGSWREAAFRFERAVAAEAGNARAWNNLAVARENLGELGEAKEAYERALDLVPDDRRIRMNYERFLNNYRTLQTPAAAAGPASVEESQAAPAKPADPPAPGAPERP